MNAVPTNRTAYDSIENVQYDFTASVASYQQFHAKETIDLVLTCPPPFPSLLRLFPDNADASLHRLVRQTSTDKPVQDIISNTVAFGFFGDQ